MKILRKVSYKEENEKDSLNAFSSLYREYSQLLSSIVKSQLKGMGIYETELYQTIINNVFLKLYEKPFSFSVPKDAKNDTCFKAWLSVVAKNELKRLIKEYYSKESSLSVLKDEPSIESDIIDDDVFESVNIKLMKEALATLNPRDKEIMITLYNYYEEGKNTPSVVLNELSQLHNTTKLNIRKIKERSEKKIIDFFSKNSQLKPLRNGK